LGHFSRVLVGCSVLLTASESAPVAGLLLVSLVAYFVVPGRRQALDALVAVLVLFVAAIAVAPSGGSGFYPRYLAAGILLAAITVGDVVGRLYSLRGVLGRAAGTALLASVLTATALGYKVTHSPIQDFRGAVRFVRAHAPAGALVIGNCFGRDLVQHYDAQIVPLTGPEQLEALLTSSGQVWAITSEGCDTGRWPFAGDKDSQAIIERHFKLETELPGAYPVRVWRFDAISADAQDVVPHDSPGSTRD
jgi:hypothetical protein